MKHLETKSEIEEFLDSIDNFLFDLDGVLWNGDDLLPYVVETLELLRQKGKKVFFITNNSTKSREQYKEKFTKKNIYCDPHEILCSAYACALYLKDQFEKDETMKDKKVYIIGGEGIRRELNLVNVPNFGVSDEFHFAKFSEDMFTNVMDVIDPKVGAVVVGYDNHFNNFKLSYACCCLRYLRNCKFIATNCDSSYPHKNGVKLPGSGSFVSALQTASGRPPNHVCGKPNTFLLEKIVSEYHMDKGRTVMIGDRLNTDILMGLHANVKTLCVMTGITDEEELKHSSIVPHFVMKNLGMLYSKTVLQE